MQVQAWKQLALQALQEQREIEMHSGYDVKESLLAVGAVESWVEDNKATSLAAFLTELDTFCEECRKHWQHPGSYNGALGTLGSCRAAIHARLDSQQKFSILTRQSSSD